MLSFGVTALPDPPYTRMIELMQFAESQGFEYAWTYDSHILWQESLRDPSDRGGADREDQARPLRDEPRDPRPDDHGELVRDDARHLERPDGDGDRPRRLFAACGRPAAGEGRGVRAALAMIKDLMNGRAVEWNEKELKLEWVRTSCRTSRCGSLATGRRRSPSPGASRDGVIIQLADPQIIQWIMDTARRAAEEAGRDRAS